MIDYDAYIEYLNLKSKHSGFDSYSDYIKMFPEAIQEIWKTEKLIRPKHLTFDACKTFLVKSAQHIEPKFVIDDCNLQVIDAISYYLSFDKAFIDINEDYKLTKGLMIMGSLGSGKTIILKTISLFLKSFEDTNYSYNPSFSILPTHRMVANFIKYGYEYFDNPQLTGENVIADNIGIDDLGAENKINYYGTPINVIGEVILRRYEKNQSQRKGMLLCTTNFNGEQIKEFYGERVHDRLVELVNPIVLTGKSRRK